MSNAIKRNCFNSSRGAILTGGGGGATEGLVTAGGGGGGALTGLVTFKVEMETWEPKLLF